MSKNIQKHQDENSVTRVSEKKLFCFSKKDRLDFSSDLNSTAKIRTASFFDHFRSLKDQKCLFVTNPTFDQRSSEYVGIRRDATTL